MAKRKVVDIAAQGAREFHVASNQDNGRRADALILYVRRIARAHNATAAQLVGEFFSRAVSGNKVLDPCKVLVVFGLGAVRQRVQCRLLAEHSSIALLPRLRFFELKACP